MKVNCQHSLILVYNLTSLPDLDVLSISEADTCGTYVFDIQSRNERDGQSQLRRAVTFAQEQLLREVEKKGYNVLLVEGYIASYLYPITGALTCCS